MGSCPFCGADVGEDILTNGGHCPSCLIEIPGEETPTDPGEAAKAQIAAEEQAAASGDAGKMVGLGVVAVLVVGVVGYLAVGGNEPEPMQIEMGEFSYRPVSEHEDLAGPKGDSDAAEAVASAPSPSGSKSPPAPSTSNAGGGSSTPSRNATVAASAPPPTGGQLQPDGPEGDPLDAVFFGDGPSQKGVQAIVLCKPGEIYEGVRAVLKVKSPQLGQCYQRALKGTESLRGRWVASFVVQKDGTPAKVEAVGQDMKDATLEDCVVTQIERWSFPQLCEPMPIETPLSFGL